MTELVDVVRGIAGRARPGEQVEAYAARSRDTDVKVFEREVAELAVAESGGVGVRVVVDGRLGYAWAGSLAPDVVDAVGNDFDTWAGTCGKEGQGVPVSSGQPTLRVAELTVGGTAS